MFINNQPNSSSFLTLKVGHRHLFNEGNLCGEGVNKVVTSHLL